MEPLRVLEKTGIIPFYFRKRRSILLFFTVAGVLLYTFGPWQRTSGFMTRWASSPVEEIYGFLHVMLKGSESNLLSSGLKRLDSEGDNHISLYNSEYSAVQWWKERTRIDQEHPVIVFSKTYCPYSKRAKELLSSLELQPPPKIIEVDLREDAQEVKQFLTRLTHHSTFPNILVKGKSLGGSDNLANLHSKNELNGLLLKAGVKSKIVEP